MERLEIENECYYHIYNRGTDKRQIFYDKQDYYRFIHYLFVCNDISAMHVGESDVATLVDCPKKDNSREQLVDIISYTLMPNHFHLLLRQKVDGGISKFIQKVSTGYTMYFNVKNKRTGALFQGRFKSKFVNNEQYLPVLVRYIHLNPLGLLKSYDKLVAENYLRNYRWSSCRDYLGEKNFPSILATDAFKIIFSGKEEHRDFLLDNLSDDTEAGSSELGDLTID